MYLQQKNICIKFINLSLLCVFNWGFPGGSDSRGSAYLQETWVRSLVQEDPLEKEMSNYFDILAWKIPWTEEPDGLQSIGS